jgi:hypothetical protein
MNTILTEAGHTVYIHRNLPRKEQIGFQMTRTHSLHIERQIFWQGRNIEVPCPYISGFGNKPSTETSHFLLVRKLSISLMRLVENSNFENVNSRLCRVKVLVDIQK